MDTVPFSEEDFFYWQATQNNTYIHYIRNSWHWKWDIYDKILGSILISEWENPIIYAEYAAKAQNNAGLDTIDQAQGVNKKQDQVICTYDDDDDVNENLVWGVIMRKDRVDCVSVSVECFFGQKIVNLDKKNDHLVKEGEALWRGKWKTIPRMFSFTTESR